MAMVHCGMLKQLCQSWLGGGSGTLQNDRITVTGGMVSTEAAAMTLPTVRRAALLPGQRVLCVEWPKSRSTGDTTPRWTTCASRRCTEKRRAGGRKK